MASSVIDAVLLPPDVQLGGDGEIERSIRLAIRRVPLFNSGNAEACAAVYEVTAATILELVGTSLMQVAGAIERSLRDASIPTVRAASWALRHAFDEVLATEQMMR
jgi:hypothetical protein